MRKVFLFLFCVVPSFVFASSAWAYEAKFVESCDSYSKGLRVSFLNVAQGSSTLLTCPDGKTQWLIDAGTSNELHPGAEELFQKALYSSLGQDTSLEHILVTHADIDHIYGLLHLFAKVRKKTLTVGRLYNVEAPNPSSELDELIRKHAAELGIPRTDVKGEKKKRLTLCQDSQITMDLEWPTGDFATKLGCPNNLNDCSIVTAINYQGVRFLLLGDTTLKWEALALENKISILNSEANVISVGHHGSVSASKALLEAVRPALAVISVGQPKVGTTEKYCYPRKGAVQRLKQLLSAPTSGIDLPIATTAICSPVEDTGERIWDTIQTPMNLMSTAAMGTVDVYAQRSAICIEGESLEKAVVFNL